MSDYLTNLLIRTRYPERTIQPHLPSMFAPLLPGSMGGEVKRGEAAEEPYPAVQANQRVPRHELLVRLSSEATGHDRETGRPSLERETRQRERTPVSTIDNERLNSSSETVSVSELKEIDLEVKSVSTLVELSSRDSEEGRASSQNPSEDNTVSLSPIDRSVVAGPPLATSMGPVKEKTASPFKFSTQAESSPSRVPSEVMKRAGRGETDLLRSERLSESPDSPLVGSMAHALDGELNSRPNGRGVWVSASSSRHPLVAVPTTQGDGEPPSQQRLAATVSEPERYASTLRKDVAGERPNASELSLDPSLVAPVPTTKIDGRPRHHTSGNPGDFPKIASTMAYRQEPVTTSLAVPRASKKFFAVRRSVYPMAEASGSQVSATDRGKPAEPVVEVTIGRVEVRAVAPPVRQEKNRKPQSAMSLDDYLKGRGGRGGG